MVHKKLSFVQFKNRNYKFVSPTKLPVCSATQNVFSTYVRSANVFKNQSFNRVPPILINFTYYSSRKLMN